MSFSVLVLCLIVADAHNVCNIFNFLVAKPAKWSFTDFAKAMIHWDSSNSLFLCSTKETFSLHFQCILSSINPTFYLYCGILFNLKIVHVAFFPSTVSVEFLSFFLAHIDNKLFQVDFICCSLN